MLPFAMVGSDTWPPAAAVCVGYGTFKVRPFLQGMYLSRVGVSETL